MVVDGGCLQPAVELRFVGEVKAEEVGLHRDVANADLAVRSLDCHGAFAQFQIALGRFQQVPGQAL